MRTELEVRRMYKYIERQLLKWSVLFVHADVINNVVLEKKDTERCRVACSLKQHEWNSCLVGMKEMIW